MAEIIKDKEFNGIQIIKNFDSYISKCTVENLELLSEQLKLYYTHPKLIDKYSSILFIFSILLSFNVDLVSV